MSRRTLYFDCFCGASGDMIVGALIDAGADFAAITCGLEALDVPGFTVAAEKVNKRGIAATRFTVTVAEDAPRPHRSLSQIVDLIRRSGLPDKVKAGSAETFERIAACEAQVHGIDVQDVHFHELGAIDSIADIVGAHLALDSLDVAQIAASPLRVGHGTVHTAHGVLPVPAPATALLLRDVPCRGGDIEGELVTPTGAALVAQLAGRFGPLPLFKIDAVGYGSGARDLADRPNVLRVFLGRESAALPGAESITIVEANIDDMNPELLPPLLEDMLRAGARDAFLTPIVGKKGRPAHQITVLCDEAIASEVAGLLFRNSTTLGVRMRAEHRICLDREWQVAETAWGAVRVKIARFDGHETTAAPEFEDCRGLAEQAGVSVRAVYEAALAAAVKGELRDA
ncbi:MAG TPA: nickel pincer cofactor biosynthesis protein LarC [Candidatus Hydrogenedentes bacterium]|nr:nickel pincer cofactor biosynthesis protein LarC [Candidatus Hydrogenedentota bacterium]